MEYSISLLVQGTASQSIIITSEGWTTYGETRRGVRHTVGATWRMRRGR